ncbi:MAG: response regulator, partial [Akkermansiaceae bacterium]|nr:response regulator [Akkermansiaceae bacterium]
MPGKDGYQVCRELKSDVSTRDVPVIFISALGDVLDKVKAFNVGGVDFITKPFQIEEVLARILGVSFATVNRWENGKTEPTGDYARVLQTLHHLTASTRSGPTIDWKR